ncbi:hypothetical protein D3C72_1732870 [compost metagenome]
MNAILGQAHRIGRRLVHHQAAQAVRTGIGCLALADHGLEAILAADALQQARCVRKRRAVGIGAAEQVAPGNIGIEQGHQLVEPGLRQARQGRHVDIVGAVLPLHRGIAGLGLHGIQPGDGLVEEAQAQVDGVDIGGEAFDLAQARPHRQ